MERPRFDIVASGERMREIRRQRNISVKHDGVQDEKRR